MLYDPQVDKKHALRQIMRNGSFHKTWNLRPQPTALGFAAFVELKAMEDPHEEYYFPNASACAVGQYLKAIGAYDENYESMSMYRDMVYLASGWRTPKRAASGRFVRRDNAEWSWAGLKERIDETWPYILDEVR